MLQKHPHLHATLIIRRDAQGNWQSEGEAHARLGYRVSGTQASPGEGVWAEWDWDGQTLTFENERFGFYSVFYARIGDGIGLSTSATELVRAGASANLDDAAIAVFLRMGYYVGDDTPFQAVRLLPPGCRLTWAGGEFRIEQHAPPIPTTASTLSRDEAVRQYGVIFQEAVEQMLPSEEDRMCVPLSAGRDSRHILYALVRAGRRPDMVLTGMSPPPRPSTDAEVASEITSRLQLPHSIIELSDNRFDDELTKDILTSFCADEHGQMLPIANFIRDNQFDVSWDGIAGDIFSCGVYNDTKMLDQFRNRQFTDLSSWLLDAEGYLPSYLCSDAYQRWNRDLATERLNRELELYCDLPNPAAPFFFYNRVRRELALSPFGIMNQRTQILAPYLWHRLFDMLINLPFEYFKGREFHSEAIDQFYTELPHVRYVSTETGNVQERFDRIRRFARRMGRYSLQNSRSQSCIRNSFLLPRLGKAYLNRSYGTEVPVLFSRILVMLHLERYVSEQGTIRAAPRA
ncbi:MAG: hypothetical protein KDA96_05195 [Planctomycetaceae bacterium]|nr:hypothetical protein [Planctomycetaceae bacterium]